MNDDIERSESGSPIYRHEAQDRPWQAPEQTARNLEDIEPHVEKYIGKIDGVYHEILSDLIHLDVLCVPATPERPYQVILTSGVSDLPMNVPEGMEDFNRVELMMALPPKWPLMQKAFDDENNYWPVRWLKMIGRLPHDYHTWIGWGHTIPNGDPPEPIANTPFSGVMLAPPYWLDQNFFQLNASTGDTVTFYVLVPLYREEMDFKLKHSAEALEEKFEQRKVGFVLDIERPNVVKKRGWFR